MEDRISLEMFRTTEREIENYKRKISRCEEDLQHFKSVLKQKVNYKNFLRSKIIEARIKANGK